MKLITDNWEESWFSVVDFMSFKFLAHRVGLSYFLGSHFSPWYSRSNIDQLPSWGRLSGACTARGQARLVTIYGLRAGRLDDSR